jgi:hypothetical protein
MKILLLFLFTAIATISISQEIDKKKLISNWKFVKMGDTDLTEDFVMIAKITDSTFTIGSQYSVSSWNYRIDELNTFVLIMEEGLEEKWEIKKLTETELVFNESESGDFYLIKTDEDLPAMVAPIEEAPMEEPKIYSIETDYKASKKTSKLLLGKWDVEMVEGIPAPEGSSLSVDFKQDFKIFLSVNGESMEKGSWKLSKDGKKIELTDYSGKVEVWGIKVLDKKALVFMDYISGEIVLKKAKK